MISLYTSDLKTSEIQDYLQHIIAPRPICFASTIDLAGNVNLSPFSFFNMFSMNPPICVFSPSRRIRDNTTKHTLENLKEVPECVINIVNYPIVQQTSLASTEYPKGINEFEKSGFTSLQSLTIKPPRVAESPVQLECRVNDIISFGKLAGAGNLVIAEVKLIHIKEDVLGDDERVDQIKIDLVARLGGDWYCRVTKDNLFKVPKPLTTLGIGVDTLPFHIRNSPVLTGNDLGRLGNIGQLPLIDEINELRSKPETVKLLLNSDSAEIEKAIHLKAKSLIEIGKVELALKYLMLI